MDCSGIHEWAPIRTYGSRHQRHAEHNSKRGVLQEAPQVHLDFRNHKLKMGAGGSPPDGKVSALLTDS